MVGWAVSYAHLWENALRSLREYSALSALSLISCSHALSTPDSTQSRIHPLNEAGASVLFRVSAKVRGSWARLHTAQVALSPNQQKELCD